MLYSLAPALRSGLLLLVAAPSFAQYDCRSSKQHGTFGAAKDAAVLWPMDLLYQRIELDLTQGSIIQGHCTVRAVPRADGISEFPLHLLALTVDSVTDASGQLSFSHGGEDLNITLPQVVGTTDTVELTVHYHGDPVTDASGFGGFYTTGQYSYNLGVAFQSVPHSFGRTWFPCVDNFTERNSFEFVITTPVTWNAWCNGFLVSEDLPSPTSRRRHWRIDETIPAYLASVSASNYVAVRDTFTSATGNLVPVDLVARPTDTTNMKNSFIHLDDAFRTFENWFGPYRWNKVGYVLTPQGAMEHSTSIHYPQAIADGSLAYQEIMAHELGHQWFGDLITCDKAEEMYINEGFAEYLSYLFLEDVLGRTSYMNTVRNNHKKMVHQAHLLDEGWWALDSVPQAWTYGEHSYNKGADVIHSLRTYMGDSLFRVGFTSLMEAFAYGPMNTELMRDHLSQSTGLDLTDFFRDWVQQPGWSAFEVHAFASVQEGETWNVEATIGQKLRGPAAPYTNVPITITALGTNLDQQFRQRVVVGGMTSTVQLTCPFQPTQLWLNDDDALSLAMTSVTDTVTSGSFLSLGLANMDLTLPTLADTAFIHAVQYWVAPDNAPVAEEHAFIVSPDRYWRLAGHWPTGVSARIFYDGRDLPTSNLDPLLMRDSADFMFREDSLVALYRTHPDAPWTEWPSSVATLGSATDGYGRITVENVTVGEYTLGWRKSAVGIDDQETIATDAWSLSPNPASTHVGVVCKRGPVSGNLVLLDPSGRSVLNEPIRGERSTIDVSSLSAGNYFVHFEEGNGKRSLVGKVNLQKP